MSMSNRISIQGKEGSFHHVAASRFFTEDLIAVPCSTFRELIKTASNPNLADGGVIAIENSIAGSILPNYGLVLNSDLNIIGEIYLSISLNLMVYPGVQLSDIKEVHSHPIALLQCMAFLEQHPEWKLVETEDTAFSARQVREQKLKHTAAVAGKQAAELFNLDIAEADIQTGKKSFTRFLVLSNSSKNNPPKQFNKASVYFQTNHTQGSLVAILIRIAACGINLSKLQSVPIPGTEWQYGFHVDMEFSSPDQFIEVERELKRMTEVLKVLGVYQRGNTV
jgi:prephenate dehydratase